jgi:hypothetical protein
MKIKWKEEKKTKKETKEYGPAYLEQPSLQVSVNENVIAIQFKTMLVIPNDFLHREQGADHDHQYLHV